MLYQSRLKKALYLTCMWSEVNLWVYVQDEVGLTEAQRQAVREVRSKYAQSMLGATAETVMRAVDLSASLALQRESYIHLLRMFTVQILTPFQVKPRSPLPMPHRLLHHLGLSYVSAACA